MNPGRSPRFCPCPVGSLRGRRVGSPATPFPSLPPSQSRRAPESQRSRAPDAGVLCPPGMVLVRSENGQLLMIPQQALAQMQAQAHAQAQPQTAMAPRPAAPSSAPPVQISAVQVSALGEEEEEEEEPARVHALLPCDLALPRLSFLLQSGGSARAPLTGSYEGREQWGDVADASASGRRTAAVRGGPGGRPPGGGRTVLLAEQRAASLVRIPPWPPAARPPFPLRPPLSFRCSERRGRSELGGQGRERFLALASSAASPGGGGDAPALQGGGTRVLGGLQSAPGLLLSVSCQASGSGTLLGTRAVLPSD